MRRSRRLAFCTATRVPTSSAARNATIIVRMAPIARREVRGSAAEAWRRSELEIDEGTGVTGGKQRHGDEKRGGDGEAWHIRPPREHILLLRCLHLEVH